MSTEWKQRPNSRPCDTALLAALHSVILIGRQKLLQNSVFKPRCDLAAGQRNNKSRMSRAPFPFRKSDHDSLFDPPTSAGLVHVCASRLSTFRKQSRRAFDSTGSHPAQEQLWKSSRTRSRLPSRHDVRFSNLETTRPRTDQHYYFRHQSLSGEW